MQKGWEDVRACDHVRVLFQLRICSQLAFWFRYAFLSFIFILTLEIIEYKYYYVIIIITLRHAGIIMAFVWVNPWHRKLSIVFQCGNEQIIFTACFTAFLLQVNEISTKVIHKNTILTIILNACVAVLPNYLNSNRLELFEWCFFLSVYLSVFTF